MCCDGGWLFRLVWSSQDREVSPARDPSGEWVLWLGFPAKAFVVAALERASSSSCQRGRREAGDCVELASRASSCMESQNLVPSPGARREGPGVCVVLPTQSTA